MAGDPYYQCCEKKGRNQTLDEAQEDGGEDLERAGVETARAVGEEVSDCNTDHHREEDRLGRGEPPSGPGLRRRGKRR